MTKSKKTLYTEQLDKLRRKSVYTRQEVLIILGTYTNQILSDWVPNRKHIAENFISFKNNIQTGQINLDLFEDLIDKFKP